MSNLKKFKQSDVLTEMRMLFNERMTDKQIKIKVNMYERDGLLYSRREAYNIAYNNLIKKDLISNKQLNFKENEQEF